MDDADILFEQRGRLGLITLNRPRALNALTHDMALQLERQLDLWRDDDRIAVVAIQGAGDRAFCAGGDIRALYDGGRPGGERGLNTVRFYADEYRMNTKIKRYPKPYISIMDGIVMGGGVGVSIHGSLRIATERTVFAMPETGIGLFPDVGGTYFLPRLPGQTGMWLGLTGSRLQGADTVAGGVCDLYVESAGLDALVEALTVGTVPEPVGSRPARAQAAEIDRLFSGASVEAVLADLEASGSDWAAKQRDTILTKSPTCTRIAFRQIREGAKLEFEDCMRLEYRLARFCMMQPDFYEGVRAVIIDKDNAPKWSPATLAEADDAHVAPAFEPLGAEELVLS
ncbi:MAG TPA: enoyl-CoA hydratase/isomerase family protein [Thermohalobaculum sp.]|nr:enoyl-CoA hydratase/isomerase family protein [Thermohalobaculum sp.]